VRADGAGATKAFLADLCERNIEFSVGFPISIEEPSSGLVIAASSFSPFVATAHELANVRSVRWASIAG